MKHLTIYNLHYQDLHKSFEQAIRAKGYRSGKFYGSNIQEFLFFLETTGLDHITSVQAKHVIDYFEYIKIRPNNKTEGGLSDSSLRNQIYVLRLFFDHLIDLKILSGSPVHLPRFTASKVTEKKVATVEEIKLLYAATNSKLERAILALAYGCGLRRSEIMMLDINDVQLGKGVLVVRSGKNGKTRTVPLSQSVIRDIREYVVNERTNNLRSHANLSHALLLNPLGIRLRGAIIYENIKRLVKRTGNVKLIQKDIDLHSLRHSIATHLLDKGADIDFVRRFLGHAMLDTTHLYSKRRKRKKLLLEAIAA
jgi:integrase/recombinase XerD